jgi:DNA-binding cell septation regulator SpoVG
MYVQLQNINPPNPMRSRMAVATVRITLHCAAEHTFTIDDVTVLRNDAGDLWVSMPRQKVAGTYVAVISLSAKMKLAIDAVVLPRAEQWLAEQAVQSQEVARG